MKRATTKSAMGAEGAVLVVESDARQREGLGRVLRADGHEVLEAANAGAAMAILSAQRPAVMVVGDGPLGRTSAQVMRALGRLERHADSPAVVVTGGTPPNTPGVTLGIQKPFRVEELLAAVERYKRERKPDG